MSSLPPSNMPPSAALLKATIVQVAPQVVTADNLGQSGDTRDMYYLLDYMCFAVDRAYPEIPCKAGAGCSNCCENQVFRVTALEWHNVRAALLEAPAEFRATAFARNQAIYSDHRADLEAMAGFWTAGDPVPPELHRLAPKSCPLLVDGACSVYESRPAICRGYGYFSATIADTSRLLICQQFGPAWVRHLEDTGIDQLPMPNWNPVQRRIEALNDGAAIKPLPLWLLELEEELEAIP